MSDPWMTNQSDSGAIIIKILICYAFFIKKVPFGTPFVYIYEGSGSFFDLIAP